MLTFGLLCSRISVKHTRHLRKMRSVSFAAATALALVDNISPAAAFIADVVAGRLTAVAPMPPMLPVPLLRGDALAAANDDIDGGGDGGTRPKGCADIGNGGDAADPTDVGDILITAAFCEWRL